MAEKMYFEELLGIKLNTIEVFLLTIIMNLRGDPHHRSQESLKCFKLM